MVRLKPAKVRPVRARPLTPDQREAIADARAVGLYALWEGKAGNTLFLYHATSGLQLGWWSPSTGRYRVRGVEGVNRDRSAVLCHAAGWPADELQPTNRRARRRR